MGRRDEAPGALQTMAVGKWWHQESKEQAKVAAIEGETKQRQPGALRLF